MQPFQLKRMDVASMSALSAACRTVVTVNEQRLCDEKEKRNRETMAMMSEDIAGVKRQREDAKREWLEAAEMCNAYKQYIEKNMVDDDEEDAEDDEEDDDEDDV